MFGHLWLKSSRIQVFTRLRPTKRKERDNNNSAYSAALSWLSLLSAVVVDHRITGQAELPARTGRTWDTGRAASCKREAPTSGVPGAEHKLRLRALQLKGCEVG